MKRNCEAMGPGEEWVDTMRLPSLRRMQATTVKADPTTSADGTTISTGVGLQVLDCTTNTAAAELSMADITGTVGCIMHRYNCLLEFFILIIIYYYARRVHVHTRSPPPSSSHPHARSCLRTSY